MENIRITYLKVRYGEGDEVMRNERKARNSKATKRCNIVQCEQTVLESDVGRRGTDQARLHAHATIAAAKMRQRWSQSRMERVKRSAS